MVKQNISPALRLGVIRIWSLIWSSRQRIRTPYLIFTAAIALPLIIDLLIYRPTLFRLVAETNFFSINIGENLLSESLIFDAGDIVLCTNTDSEETEGVHVACNGFSSSRHITSAFLEIEGSAMVDGEIMVNGDFVLDISLPLAHTNDSCISRIIEQKVFEEPINPFHNAAIPTIHNICDSFRVVISRSNNLDTRWLVASFNDVTVGSDIGPGERLNSAALETGSIDVFTTSLQGDVHASFHGEQQRGNFLKVKSHPLHLGDVVKLTELGKIRSLNHMTVRITPRGSLIVSVWRVSETAIISSFGMPSFKLKATYSERIANDELIGIYVAFLILIFPFMLSAFIRPSGKGSDMKSDVK